MTNPYVQIVSPNIHGRDFVISDIHGCYFALNGLLSHVGFLPSMDRLFSVGDLVDRGTHSLEVLDLLKEPWFFACRGNHEQMLIDHLRRPDLNKAYDTSWLAKEIKTSTERQRFAGRYLPMLEKLPLVYRINGLPGTLENNQRALSKKRAQEKGFYVVHAEILDEKKSVDQKMIEDWSFQDPVKARHRCMWGRSLIKSYHADRPVKRAHEADLPLIFSGHVIVPAPIQIARQIYLDGGGYLTFEDKIDRAVVKKPCLRMYDITKDCCLVISSETGVVWEEEIEKPLTF